MLWVGVVGDPSAGKSPGADPVLEILRSLETEMAAGFEATHREWATARESAKCAKDQWVKDVASARKEGTSAPIMPASAVEPPEPVRPRILVSDATPEALGSLAAAYDKGLLFFRDELAGGSTALVDIAEAEPIARFGSKPMADALTPSIV